MFDFKDIQHLRRFQGQDCNQIPQAEASEYFGIGLLSPHKCFFQFSIVLYSSRVPVWTSLYVLLFLLSLQYIPSLNAFVPGCGVPVVLNHFSTII